MVDQDDMLGDYRICSEFTKKKELVLDDRFAGAWNPRKHAEWSPNMFLWKTYAAVVRPTPSELGARLILVLRQAQNLVNP